MGQSNATGVSQHQYLLGSEPEVYAKYSVGNPNVLISYDVDDRVETNFVPVKFGYGHNENYFGPEIGISEVISQNEGTSYIIKATMSGSCLLTQYMTSTGFKLQLYYRYVNFLKQQLRSLESQGFTPRLRGLFWMQGESDSFLDYSYQYYYGEWKLFESLRIDLNEWIYDHFNIVDAYICTHTGWKNPEVINNAKQRIADESDHFYCLKTNGEDESALSLKLKYECGEEEDGAHYDSKSMLLLGRAASQYLSK